MVLEVAPLLIEEVLGGPVLLAGLIDQLVPLPRVLHRVLPLQVQLVPLRMETLELLRRLVQLDLRRLSLRNLLLKLFSLTRYLNCQLLDVQG